MMSDSFQGPSSDLLGRDCDQTRGQIEHVNPLLHSHPHGGRSLQRKGVVRPSRQDLSIDPERPIGLIRLKQADGARLQIIEIKLARASVIKLCLLALSKPRQTTGRHEQGIAIGGKNLEMMLRSLKRNMILMPIISSPSPAFEVEPCADPDGESQ